MRIKSHWFKGERQRPPEEVATVIAAIVWRTANHGLQGLRKAKYDIDAGVPYISVLVEFLVFLVLVADRIAYRHDPGDWRAAFTIALAKRVAGILQENLDDLIGPIPEGHGRAFLERFDEQSEVYGQFGYAADGPEFAFLRHFGDRVAEAMPEDDDRRWAQDQVMTVQGPETVALIERAMRGALGLEPKRGRATTAPE